MNATVRVLRCAGRRKVDRDIQSEHGTAGVLTLASSEGVFELKLYDSNASQMKSLIPLLLEARVVSIRNSRMLFQGLTAGWIGGVAQKWSTELAP